MSGAEYLLDTNVVIGLLKGHDPAVTLIGQAGLAAGRVAVSQITRMELLGYSGLTDDEEQAVLRLLSMCKALPITDAVESLAIALRRSGKLRLPDAIIAATALACGAKLLTLDERMARVFAQEVAATGAE